MTSTYVVASPYFPRLRGTAANGTEQLSAMERPSNSAPNHRSSGTFPRCASNDEHGQAAQVDYVLDVTQSRLHAALTRFYQDRQEYGKMANVDRIVQRYSGDHIVDLWAALGIKYSLPPYIAVKSLAKTLHRCTAVQWSKEDVPEDVLSVLEALSFTMDGMTHGSGGYRTSFDAAMRTALDQGHATVAGAIVFSAWDILDLSKLRSRLWRLLLRQGDRDGGAGVDKTVQEGQLVRHEFHGTDKLAEPSLHEPENCSPLGRYEDAIHAAVVEAVSAWRHSAKPRIGDAGRCVRSNSEEPAGREDADVEMFFECPDLAHTVGAIVSTQVQVTRQHLRGACRVAAMLLYVMANGDATMLQEAKADAHRYLSQFASEFSDTVSGEASLRHSRRIHDLLRIYDPHLAAMLLEIGLIDWPDRNFVICSFLLPNLALQDCLRIWDLLLAGPDRFELSVYTVVALMICCRGELLEHSDPDTLLEKVADCEVDVNDLLCCVKAICAFERRCAVGRAIPFPPRSPVVDRAFVAQEAADNTVGGLSSLWQKVQAVGMDAWHVVENAPVCSFQPQTPLQAARRSFAVAAHVNEQKGASLSLPTRLTLRSGEVNATVLSRAMAECLADHLPASLRLPGAFEWVLRYSPKAHGVSLATLYRNLADLDKTILVVQDYQEHVFGGFAPVPWEYRKGFYGTGEAFVFSFGRPCDVAEEPQLQTYPWTSQNSFFMYSDLDYLAMGGGEGGHAVMVRNDLLRGGSSPTPTFANPTLAAASEFVVRDIEVWALEDVKFE